MGHKDPGTKPARLLLRTPTVTRGGTAGWRESALCQRPPNGQGSGERQCLTLGRGSAPDQLHRGLPQGTQRPEPTNKLPGLLQIIRRRENPVCHPKGAYILASSPQSLAPAFHALREEWTLPQVAFPELEHQRQNQFGLGEGFLRSRTAEVCTISCGWTPGPRDVMNAVALSAE